jgi:hypothetical protein
MAAAGSATAAAPAPGSATPPATGSATPPATDSATAAAPAPTASGSAAPAATAANTSPAAPKRPARLPLGFRVDRLGAAAARALQHARTATAPTQEELAPIAALIARSGNALATISRNQSAIVLLRGDLMFKEGVLTSDGRRLVRELAKALAAMQHRGFRVVADPERAMELASRLVIAGLPADRIEIALVAKLDPALDLLQLEITSAPSLVQPEAAP